jgi:hypothetical protein
VLDLEGDSDLCGPVYDADLEEDFEATEYGDGIALAATVALPRNGIEISERWANAIAAGIVAAAAGATAAELAESIRACYRSPVLSVIRQVLPFEHPCDRLPTFTPGVDILQATLHDEQAILAEPHRGVLQYASEAENTARGVPRRWKNNVDPCPQSTVLMPCDEMPFYSTATAGPGASLKLIPRADNSGEGTWLQRFYNGPCTGKLKVPPPALRVHFIVAPSLTSGTTYHCGAR